MFHIDVQPFIIHHGYLGVFLIVMLESTGVPLPGETALLLASAYAGATGHLFIVYVLAAAIAGAIIGDNFGYWIGRLLGARVLERYGRFIGLTSNRLALGEHLFERHGGKIVFFGRYVAFLRVLAALFAGLNKYRWRSFLFFNATGAVTWATVTGLGGYLFGDTMTRVSGPLGMIGFGLVVLGILVFWLILRRQEKKWEERLIAEALHKEAQEDAYDRECREPPDAA